MNKKAVVIEINEVPLKFLNHYKKVNPHSQIAFLLDNSLVLETKAKDVEEDFLYPSQTWGSISTNDFESNILLFPVFFKNQQGFYF